MYLFHLSTKIKSCIIFPPFLLVPCLIIRVKFPLLQRFLHDLWFKLIYSHNIIKIPDKKLNLPIFQELDAFAEKPQYKTRLDSILTAWKHFSCIFANVKYRGTVCLTFLSNEPWNTFATVDLVILSNMAIKSHYVSVSWNRVGLNCSQRGLKSTGKSDRLKQPCCSHCVITWLKVCGQTRAGSLYPHATH